MIIKTRSTCRICGSPIVPFLDLGYTHLQGAFITETNKPSNRKVPVVVCKCHDESTESGCGLVQLKHSVEPDILYSSYFYKSSITVTMKNHLKQIVDNVVELIGDKKKVLDVGCNDLTTLKYYPQDYTRIGIDPSDVLVKDNEIKTIKNYFPAPFEFLEDERTFDAITFIACFYDCENPSGVFWELRRLLSKTGIIVVEVAYLLDILNNLAWDGFVHEHLTYFSFDVLDYLAKLNGLKIFRAETNDINGGSIQIWLCNADINRYDYPEYKDNILKLKINEFDAELDKLDTYFRFADKVGEHGNQLKDLLKGIKTRGKKIALYGVSTKINLLVENLSLQEYLEFGIERTKEKIGGETLYGLKIIGEEEFRKDWMDKIDYLFIGPYGFSDEIKVREKAFLDKGGKMIFCLPPPISIFSSNGTEKV